MSTSTVDFLSKEGVATLWQTIKEYAVANELLAQPSGVATLDEFGKVLQTQLPDYILGQVLFGGTIDGNGVATLTTLFKNRYNLSVATLDVDNLTAANYEGSYFIATANGVSGIAKTLDIVVGDWVISNGSEWTKIDNTDAVRTVLGLKGDIQAPDLRNAMLGKSGNQGTNLALGDIWMGNGDGTVVTHRTSIFARSILASIAENTMFSKLWADRATNDGNGKNIANTYMPFAGGIFTGDVTHNAHLILANSKVIAGKDTAGSNVSLLSINTSNQVVIGYGAHNKYDTLLYGNKIIAYGDVCGQKGVSAKGIADFGLISGSGGGGGTAYTLNIVPSDSKVSIQLKGADGSSDTKEISIFSTSQAGIVAKAPSASSVLRGNGWGTLAFSELASKPTTLGGYGITDAYSKSQIENGIFPNMRVGLADDLGDIEETLDEEYTFQSTANPNEIRDGYAQIESLKGNSLVWNQNVENGDFSQGTGKWVPTGYSVFNVENGVATVSCTSDSDNFVYQKVKLIIGHSYLLLVDIKSYVEDRMSFMVFFGEPSNYYVLPSNPSGQWEGKSIFFSCVTNTHNEVRMRCSTTLNTNYFRKIKLYDLTQMFGEGNEPTTIEEFERRCPKGMSMDYNEGEIVHFNGDIKSVGFNQWDEEWEVGSISANGDLISSTSTIRSKNFNSIIEGAKYYGRGVRFNYYIILYDSNYNYVDRWQITSRGRDEIIPEPRSRYFKIVTSVDYNPTYNHDICINLSDPDKNGTYEPYTEFRRDLPTELFDGGMKSAGTAYDEVYWDEAKGKYIKVTRIGEVDLGTLNWAYEATYSRFKASIPNHKYQPNTLEYPNIICSKYLTAKASTFDNQNLDKSISSDNKVADIYIRDSAYTDTFTFKAAMSGVMLYYELAEPIVEEIDIPYMDYQVSNDGTEEIVSDVPTTPIKARVTYNFDTIGTVKQNRFDISTIRSEGITKNNIGSQSVASAKILKNRDNQSMVYQTNNGNLYVGDNIYQKSETHIIGRNIHLRYGDNASYGFLLNASGNVGIGTTNPQCKLDVNGSFNALTGFIGGKNILHAGNTKLTLDAAYNWEDKNSQTNKQVYGFTLNVNGTEIGMSAITKEELEAMLV